ncbi:MAG: hypothetical protein JSS30_01030 [Verrucomicrobia bacterium]|nr:hypothetical protein [Verrucomicrobiota bacterium]
MKVAFSMSNLNHFLDNTETEMGMRFQELEALFPCRKCWDEKAWGHFRGFNLNCEIAQPDPLGNRIYELARETISEDDMRVILIPGRLSLDKLKLILKYRNIPLSIEVDPAIEKCLGETNEPSIYVAKTDTNTDFIFDERFKVLTLVTLACLSYGTVKNKTILFEDTIILCSDVFEGRFLAVTLTNDKITIAPCLDVKDPKVVTGTCVKAN